ncbi:MAG: DNA-directed RNA polymerase subunit B [Candidatus Micrarchaeia archaeon]
MKENKCQVFLNGKNIGYVKDGQAFANEIRKNRRLGLISGEANVAYFKDSNEIHINADKGRIRKPYIVVENGKSTFTQELKEKLARKEIDFNYLVRNGIIEYLDAEEEENIKAVLKEEDIDETTTHLEIDPASNLGLTMNLGVFPEYNTVGKHPISANFIKQSQGLFAINFNKRFDARGFVLYYPQVPIVDSAVYRAMKFERHPAGQNLIVAMTTYYGFNLQDAVILNKASIDRGMGRSVFYKSYADEERRYPGGQQDEFRIPDPSSEGYLGEHAYSKLGEDGIIEKEMNVTEGDVIIGKVSPPRFIEEQTALGAGIEKYRDGSTTLKANEDGVVDEVLVTETVGATRLIKVRVRSIKVPEIGDKFASRHGQKGVTGMIVNQEDMPFSKEGLIPDFLLNPLSVTSRMTFGHLLEMMGGKVGALSGRRIDGTAFSNKKGRELIDEYGDILEKYGFDRMGDEVLYDGRTGKKFNAKIFMGVVYYNRLWHMVSLKLQVRSRGPVQILTHQPTEGKPRRGGLKFGEMERDALVGHGASILIKDRMLDQSDKAEVWVCKKCHSLGYYDYIRKMPVCPIDGPGNMVNVEISYAFKLLLDEIKSMHIFPKIMIKDGD